MSPQVYNLLLDLVVLDIQTSKNFSSSPPSDYKGESGGVINLKIMTIFGKQRNSAFKFRRRTHGDLRNLVAKAFSNRPVQELRPLQTNQLSF